MRASRVVVALAVAGLVPTLAACGGQKAQEPGQPTAATAFVVGARANMPPPRLDGDAREAVDRAVEQQALVSVIVADGQPAVAESTWLRIRGANDVARQQSRKENREAVERAVAGVRADGEETDLLTALDLAARELSAIDGEREIVVVDSGLSTSGPLDFTEDGMLDAEPADVVADLESADVLPDLCGTRVTLQGIGDTALPQEAMGVAQRRHLIDIWTAVLEASCSDDVSFVEVQLRGAPYEDVPPVTPVPLPQVVECTTSTVVLSGGEVAFRPDTAEFRDRSAARTVLEPIAAQLVRGQLEARVTGTTANLGSMEGQRQLSRQRAEAVLAELVALGVPPGALQAVGAGSDFPQYVQDGGPEGPLDPAAAAQNRKVFIELLEGVFSCG